MAKTKIDRNMLKIIRSHLRRVMIKIRKKCNGQDKD